MTLAGDENNVFLYLSAEKSMGIFLALPGIMALYVGIVMRRRSHHLAGAPARGPLEKGSRNEKLFMANNRPRNLNL